MIAEIKDMPICCYKNNYFGEIFVEKHYLYLNISLPNPSQIIETVKADLAKRIHPLHLEEKNLSPHVSIIYPDEIKNQKIDLKKYLGRKIEFSLSGLYEITMKEIGRKYFVFKVLSNKLAKIRFENNLPESLSYKGTVIFFHLTIGRQKII